jgi:hypothetical protein
MLIVTTEGVAQKRSGEARRAAKKHQSQRVKNG